MNQLKESLDHTGDTSAFKVLVQEVYSNIQGAHFSAAAWKQHHPQPLVLYSK
jgi:hypothetical protein